MPKITSVPSSYKQGLKEKSDLNLVNEDCLIAFNGLTENSIDLIATDPPYFLDGMGDEWSDESLNAKKRKAGTIKGLPVGMRFDPAQGRRLETFFHKVSKEAFRVMKPGAFLISFSQGRLFHRLAIAAENAGFEVRDMLIWEHEGGQGKAFTQKHFVEKMDISNVEKSKVINALRNRKTPQLRPKFEAILMAQKPKEGTFVNNWMKWETGLVQPDLPDLRGGFSQQTTIFNYKKAKHKMIDHMTVKPVDLMARIIEVFSMEGQTVLDPFMGSGSTGVAAIEKGRKFVGFEIEPKYFNIAVKRINNHEDT